MDPATHTVSAFSGVRLTIPGTSTADPSKTAHQSVTTTLEHSWATTENRPFQIHVCDNRDSNACRIWKLIPECPDVFDSAQQTNSVPASGSGLLPPYDGGPGNQRCACTHQTRETNDDDDGYETTVVETTVTKKTVTRRKKQRAEGE